MFLLDLVFPAKCGLCGSIGRKPVCPECLAEFQPAASLLAPAGCELIAGVADYSGRAAQAVRRLKYERVTSLAAPMGKMLTAKAEENNLFGCHLAVPVPISRSRLRERGFNQAELLCEGLKPAMLVEPALARTRHTRPQVGLSREERLKNLEGVFQAVLPVRGKDILLVDDVSTSGGTATACASALLAAGANRVVMLAFALESFHGSGRPEVE